MKNHVFLIIAMVWGIAGCKSEYVAPYEVAGWGAKVITNAGAAMEQVSFLPSPVIWAQRIEGQDTFHLAVLASHTDHDSIGTEVIASFDLTEGDRVRKVLLAYPTDTALQVVNRLPFNELMLRHHAIKVILDNYFHNYKGMGVTKVTNWQGTTTTLKYLDDLAQAKTSSQ